MSYTDLSAALIRAKERSGATDTDDAFLTELLIISAGRDPQGTTQYRPFFVAGKWLEQNLAAQTISEDQGTKFTGLAVPIDSLLRIQASIDAALSLEVPEGFEAIAPGCSTCGGGSRYRSRSLSTTLRP